MIILDAETVEVISKLNETLKETKFEINTFTVGETGAGGIMLTIDIRKHICEGE